MAFFNVTPAEKVDRLTDTFDKGFSTTAQEFEQTPSAFEGDFLGLGSASYGIASGFNRSKYNLYADSIPEEAARKKEIAESIRRMRPDPKTVGSVGQIMFGLAEPLAFIGTQFMQDPITSVLAPSTLAISTTKDYAPAQTELNVADGMDRKTAESVARTQSIAMGAGVVLPVSVGGNALVRAISGGLINTAAGGLERFEIGRTLRANGYEEMAKQYSALDTNSAIAEFVLGAAFGGAFGPRQTAKATVAPNITPNITPNDIAPSQIDAALTQGQNYHAAIDTAPGIPANGKSAQAHSSALNSAIESLAFGDKVNVENLLTEAGFLGKRPDFNAVAVIREELEKAGFNDVAGKVRALETAAKERGLYVEPTDMNVVLSDAPSEIKVGGVKGRESAVKIGNDYVPVQYRLMESADVSGTMGKADNQYRDRTRVASEQQIQEAAGNLDPRLLGESPVMDFGAPVMTADGKIIAGNGRAAFIERAYATNGGESYRSYLKDNAEALGLNASEIDGMTNPVLVRVLQRDVDVNKAAILSNEGGAMGMSALEQAKVDGERLGDFRAFQFGEDGSLSNVGNMPFIRTWVEQFPTNQISRLMDADGMLSAEGNRRLQNAIMYRAFGDSDTLSRLVEATDPGSRNIVNALGRTAARVADAKEAIARGDLYPLDLSEDIIMAVEKYASLKNTGMDVNTWVNQIDGFGDGLTGEARAMVVMMDKNIRSAKSIAEAIDGYYMRLEELGDPKQGSMFEAATPTKQDIFAPMLDGEVMYSRDAGEPIPDGVTMIDIGGVSRHVTNSEGVRIGTTKESIAAFYDWFGNSKVVDAEGRPIVVYHGTADTFNTIDLEKGAQGLFWFTSNKSAIEAGEVGAAGAGKIMPLYVKMENPANWRQYDQLGLYEFKSRGLDGAILPDSDGTFTGFVMRPDENQIKSVNNRGTFDPNNPNINYSRGGSKSNVTELESVFKAQFGKDASRLIELGRVKMVQSVAELPARLDATPHPSDVGGMYDPRTGMTYIVADNTAPSQIRGRVLHEIGVHSGMETMLGDALYADVLAQVDARIAMGDARFMEARRLASENSVNEGQIAQETLAYLVENAPEIPLVRRIMAAVRQWVYRTTGGRFVDLDVNDLVAIARASLRRQSRMDATAMGGDVMYTRAQESTAEFKRWFGESKVVDENGKPLVVYHGTGADIEKFEASKAQDKEGRKLGLGLGKGKFYLSGNTFAASDYAENAPRRKLGDSPNVLPLYASVKNPIDMDSYQARFAEMSGGKQMWDSSLQQKERDSIIAKLDKQIKSDGFDGIVEYAPIGGGKFKIGQIAVFDPTQIKSAVGNSGAFNPDSPSLTDRVASTNEFYRNASNGDMISTNDNPLPTTMIPTGDTLEPIGIAIAKANAEVTSAQTMEPGFLSAVECALVAGE